MAVEKDVRSELGKLPAELKEQYKIIYEDILEAAPSTASIARKTFAWMLVAQRILTLEEMIAAVALDEQGYYHHDLSVPRLLDICRNLLVVTSINHTSEQKAFQMAHLSVREFLEDLPEFSAEQLHTDAVSRLLDNFDSGLWLEKNFLVREKSMKRLRNYTIYLFEHAEMSQLAKPECHLARKMRYFLFNDLYESTSMLNQWHQIVDEFRERSLLSQDFPDISFYRKYHRSRFSHLRDGALHLICMHGLLSVLQVLDDDDASVPWKASTLASSGFNELFQATRYGKSTVVKWLLERHIFHPDETPKHRPALFFAVPCHMSEIVDLLLKYGADPLSSLEEGFHSTPWSNVFAEHNYNTFNRMFRSIELLEEECRDKYSSLTFDWRLEGLIEALRENWTKASLFLIQRGANDRSQISRSTEYEICEDERQSGTLQIAVKYSEVKVVEALLDRSQARDAKSNKSVSLLPDGESRDHQAYVNYMYHHRRSALHYLMMRESTNSEENEEIMRLLWKHGADLRAVSGEGHTTLHVAAAIGSTLLISLLLEEGFGLEARTNSGATALHVASGGIHRAPQVIRYLTDKGLDPLGRDSGGRTPLHYAAAACNIPAFKTLLEILLERDNMSLTEAKRLSTIPSLSHGACTVYEKLVGYVNITDDKGESLLHLAGTDVRIDLDRRTDIAEQTILDIKDTVCLITDLGAKLDQTARSKTPLLSQLARSYGYGSGIIAAKELLRKGANPNIPDSNGKTVLHYGALFIVGLIEGTDLVDDLLEAGANIEARDDDLRTPLHWAPENGPTKTLQSLLLRNANCEVKDRKGATPLHSAAKSQNAEVIAMLIRKGASVQSADNSGATPLHYAATPSFNRVQHLFTEGIEMLIKKGANVQSADELGATPLHLATKAGWRSAVSILIRHGANPEAVDRDGKTPLHYAAKYASIICEDVDESAEYSFAWLCLFKASEDWCRRNKSRPQSPLKRTQSQILRTDQSWGDFSNIMSKDLVLV